MKKAFKTGIAMILAIAILVSANIPLVQAHALAVSSSKNVISAQIDGWNISENLQSDSVINALPAADCNPDVVRQPDTGEKADEAFRLWNSIVDLFTRDTIVRSKGDNSTAVIYEDIDNYGMTVSDGGAWVNLTPASGSFDVSAVTDCAVRCTNVFDNVDYQFAAVDGDVKAKVVFEGQSNKYNFGFNIS